MWCDISYMLKATARGPILLASTAMPFVLLFHMFHQWHAFFCALASFSLPVLGYVLTLSAAGQAGGPRVHHRASLGRARAPWPVL